MKKIAFIAFAGAMTLASCKKDWTCKCTTTYNDGTTASTSSTTTITDHTSDAKAKCEDMDESNAAYSKNCEITG